jgi:capsular polysaccharide biosynthesis protein
MDLRLYGSVLWRFRVVVAIGLVVACILTVLSVARVSFAHGFKLSYRHPAQWASTSTLWVTQAGFPVGRSVYDKFLPGPGTTLVPQYNDPSRFADYATIYANLVSSDQVLGILEREGPVDGSIQATQPTLPGNSNATLPFFDLTATSTSASGAVGLASRAIHALITYVQNEQRANGIAPNKRVVLAVVRQPSAAALVKGHKLTTPIVVFIATLLATMGLVFLLENMRPRIREVPGIAEEETAPVAPARHTA